MIVAERPAGTFTRQVFLGETLDAEHIDASYTAGVLTLAIPVHEAAKPRTIQITSHDHQQASHRQHLNPVHPDGRALALAGHGHPRIP